MLRSKHALHTAAFTQKGAADAPTRFSRGDLGVDLEFAATHKVSYVFRRLVTSQDGLTEDIVRAQLDLHGKNVMTERRAEAPAVRFVRSFVSPFTLILVALAIISYYTNVVLVAPEERDPSTTIIIAVMVAISGTLRFTQESKGASAAAALKKMVTTTCCVVRKGVGEGEIPFEDVAVGDIIKVSSGDMVPADSRLVTTKDLFVTQAALTGEGGPVEKFSDPVVVRRVAGDPNPTLALTDCTNILFTGTTVQSGSATAVVVATGDDTYVGRMMSVLQAKPEQTSFDAGVASVSRVLVVFMLVMCPVVLVVNGLTKGDWLSALLFSVSVAVGITPQMLPVIVTTCLSRGASAMAHRDVIVKNINSIQNLGAMDVLCCDKTGTLTQDKVILERHLDVMGRDDDRVLRHAFLNSYFQTGLRNLLDVAVIEKTEEFSVRAGAGRASRYNGLDTKYVKVDEVPFDFERRRMSVVVADDTGKTQMITKGAVEEVLAVCAQVEYGGVVRELTNELRSRVMRQVSELNDDGMRVIAVAQKTNPRPVGMFSKRDECDMVLIGYLAFLDPPKDSAAKAISRLAKDGVCVKILTGDNGGVAAAVCRKVGVNADGMLLGSELDALSDEELARRADSTQLFAKLSPLQKARVVRVLRSGAGRDGAGSGHVVGFMGDGINDAAAMRASDVGISVDTAVDVAKESADIILLEKDLMVLDRGIVEGRKTYGNTIKYIKSTVSSNFGNVFSVMVASAFLPFLPMTALQLLLLGLAYTVSCTAVPWDNVDEEFLSHPRTWDARAIVGFMLWLGPTSSVFDILTYAVMFFWLAPMVVGAPWATLVTLGDTVRMAAFATVFQTGWFVESMWTQTFVLHTLRTERLPFVQSHASWQLTLLTATGVIVVTLLPYLPGVSGALGLSALPAAYYGVLLAFMVGYLTLANVVKKIYARRYGGLL